MLGRWPEVAEELNVVPEESVEEASGAPIEAGADQVERLLADLNARSARRSPSARARC